MIETITVSLGRKATLCPPWPMPLRLPGNPCWRCTLCDQKRLPVLALLLCCWNKIIIKGSIASVG